MCSVPQSNNGQSIAQAHTGAVSACLCCFKVVFVVVCVLFIYLFLTVLNIRSCTSVREVLLDVDDADWVGCSISPQK